MQNWFYLQKLVFATRLVKRVAPLGLANLRIYQIGLKLGTT